jgi:pilus assembly protein CpaB
MKPKTLVLMGVAIACGLGASYMTSRLLAERGEEEPKVTVLVAKKNLNLGETIRNPEEWFVEKKFTRGDEQPGAIDNFESLKNRVLKRPLRAGDHVTPEDLIGDVNSAGMAISMPDGHRGVGVRVNAESVASGWASLPLSRVDVISTVRRADDKATYSQILLENVLVLAADAEMRRDESGKAMPAQVVTLALKPEDSVKVRLAGAVGELSLILRKINDRSKAENPKVTYADLKAGRLEGDEPIVQDGKGEEKPVQVAENKVPEKPVADKKPEAPAAPVVVAEEKPAGKSFRMTIHEGGRTRFVEYLLNDAGEAIEVGAPAGAHPPRPTEATEPKK